MKPSSAAKTNPMPPTDLVPMAKVGSPFGIRGWVHVFADTEYPDSLFDYDELWLGRDGAWRLYTLEEAQLHGKGMVAKFSGCEDRDQAMMLRNMDIAIPRSDLPKPDEDEFYWADLIGLEVRNTQGETLGTVHSLMESGAHDILVVNGDRQRLIPFVRNIVLNVDNDAKVIEVEWGSDY